MRTWKEKHLRYAKWQCCPCGARLAYPRYQTRLPKGLVQKFPRFMRDRFWHQLVSFWPNEWDCSAILLGTADEKITHTAILPFVFYDIK